MEGLDSTSDHAELLHDSDQQFESNGWRVAGSEEEEDDEGEEERGEDYEVDEGGGEEGDEEGDEGEDEREDEEKEDESMEVINPEDIIQGSPDPQNGCEFESDDMIEGNFIDEDDVQSSETPDTSKATDMPTDQGAEVFIIAEEATNSDGSGAYGTVLSADDYTGFIKLKQFCNQMADENNTPELVDPTHGTKQMLDAIRMMENDKITEVKKEKSKKKFKDKAKEKSKEKSKNKSKDTSKDKPKRKSKKKRSEKKMEREKNFRKVAMEMSEPDDGLPGYVSYLLPPMSGKMEDVIGVRCDDTMEAGKLYGPYGGNVVEEVEGYVSENAWEVLKLQKF